MLGKFKRLVRSLSTGRKLETPHHPAPMFQHLEKRTMLSASLEGGVLMIDGSAGPDKIAVVAGPEPGQVKLKGVDGVDKAAIFEGVTRIEIRTGDGNDKIAVKGNLVDAAGNVIDMLIDAGEGNNKIKSGLGDDTIITGAGNDKIKDAGGDNVIDADDGNNKIRTGAGDDEITTGSGRDKIKSGAGDDTIDAGAGDDKVAAGDGDDDVRGGAGAAGPTG